MEMNMEAKWMPQEKHGRLIEQSDLPDGVFAFPKQRRERLTDASQLRNSNARFDQVIGVTDDDRERAFANISGGGRDYGADCSSHLQEMRAITAGAARLNSGRQRQSLRSRPLSLN
jgi:hypothetical protein